MQQFRQCETLNISPVWLEKASQTFKIGVLGEFHPQNWEKISTKPPKTHLCAILRRLSHQA